MISLRQYLLTLDDPRGLTRTLDGIEACRDAAGRPCCTVGNSAAVFRVHYEGRLRSLRCYMRPTRHAAEIYGSGFRPKELFIYTSPSEGVWVDVVLGDWIEGVTLREAIVAAADARDTARLECLAKAFDRFAAVLVADDRAHGDLKPENLIVDAAGGLHPIDFDAAFLPAFAGEPSPELGTAAYQHPARTAADFDAWIDDYPAALISAALHALALDPSLYDRYRHVDGLLFTPQHIPTDPALQEALALFERQGRAAEYRMARLLLSPNLRLPALPKLLDFLANGPAAPVAEPAPELFVENGLWGYRTECAIAIPPLYDCGFEFSEGLAAVRLGRTWHYIDPAGRTVLRCPDYEAVKPFRDGRAQAIRNGLRLEIDRTGRPCACEPAKEPAEE